MTVATNPAVKVLTTAAERMVVTGMYPSPEKAMAQIALTHIDREIADLERQIAQWRGGILNHEGAKEDEKHEKAPVVAEVTRPMGLPFRALHPFRDLVIQVPSAARSLNRAGAKLSRKTRKGILEK